MCRHDTTLPNTVAGARVRYDEGGGSDRDAPEDPGGGEAVTPEGASVMDFRGDAPSPSVLGAWARRRVLTGWSRRAGSDTASSPLRVRRIANPSYVAIAQPLRPRARSASGAGVKRISLTAATLHLPDEFAGVAGVAGVSVPRFYTRGVRA